MEGGKDEAREGVKEEKGKWGGREGKGGGWFMGGGAGREG